MMRGFRSLLDGRNSLALRISNPKELRDLAQRCMSINRIHENANRLQAFAQFMLGKGAFDHVVNNRQLGQAVQLANAVTSDWKNLWLAEGMGFSFGNFLLRHKTNLRAGELRPVYLNKSLELPWHTGIGLAFAARIVGQLGLESRSDQVADALRRYFSLCRHFAQPSYHGVVSEAIGLVVITTRPDLLGKFCDALVNLPVERNRFWHGVGRGSYFSSISFFPCLDLIETNFLNDCSACQDNPDLLNNYLAGVAWAITLVNLRNEEVSEEYRRKMKPNSFSHGESSAKELWRRWIGKQETASSQKATSAEQLFSCLLYTSPSPRDRTRSRMPSSA